MSAMKCLLLIVLAVLLAAGACVAQTPKYVPPTTYDIALGNTKFFDILTPAAGYTVDERQKLVNGRLIDIFAAGRPEPVTVSCVRGKPTIFVNGIKLITVYPRDAEAAGGGICTQQLADKWAQSLKDGLTRVWPGCRFPTQKPAPKAAAASGAVAAAQG
jgi:hypothetical protein